MLSYELAKQRGEEGSYGAGGGGRGGSVSGMLRADSTKATACLELRLVGGDRKTMREQSVRVQELHSQEKLPGGGNCGRSQEGGRCHLEMLIIRKERENGAQICLLPQSQH